MRKNGGEGKREEDSERERGSAVSSEAENLVTVFRGGSKSFIQ